MIPLAQRIRQARAHGMRSGATEALRQLGVRLAALTTDEERRKVGLTQGGATQQQVCTGNPRKEYPGIDIQCIRKC